MIKLVKPFQACASALPGKHAIGPGVLHRHTPSRSRRWKAQLVCSNDGVARRNSLRRASSRASSGMAGLSWRMASQPTHQHQITERLPLRCWFTGGQLGDGEYGIAQLLEPAEGCLLDVGFAEGHLTGRLGPVIKSALDLGPQRCMPGEHPQPGCTRDHLMVKVVLGLTGEGGSTGLSFCLRPSGKTRTMKPHSVCNTLCPREST